MKKLLALILTIGMVFSLAACGGENTEKETEKKPKQSRKPKRLTTQI